MTELVRFLAGAEASAWRARFRAKPGEAAPDPLAVAAALRSAFDPARARALAEQILLEPRAGAKLPFPRTMLFERVPLEQATSPGCAAWHAASVPRGATVVDAGCGLGADLLAFANAGHRTIGIERDAHRAALARHNLGVAEPGAPAWVARGDAAAPPARGDVLFADPDRRAGGRRVFDLAEGSPSWAELSALRDRFASLRVKAPPAIPDGSIPEDAAVEFLSEGGECREAFLRLGPGERAGSRAAVLLEHGEVRYTGPALLRVTDRGRFLLDPDPALRRAGGVDVLADELDAARVAEESTYLFAERAPDSPWVRTHEVLEVFPYRPRDLARRLAEAPPRELVVKQRGLALPESAVRRGLPSNPEGPVRVLVLFPRGRARVACLCAPAIPR